MRTCFGVVEGLGLTWMGVSGVAGGMRVCMLACWASVLRCAVGTVACAQVFSLVACCACDFFAAVFALAQYIPIFLATRWPFWACKFWVCKLMTFISVNPVVS
jgi:hypothetical protein